MRAAIITLILILPFCLLSQNPPPKYNVQNEQLILKNPVAFEGQSDKLTSASDEALNEVAGYMDMKRMITLMRIEIHYKGSADDEDKASLAASRAKKIVQKLIDKKVDCKRLIAVTFAEYKGEEDYVVKFFNAELRDRIINGIPIHAGGEVVYERCE